MVSWAKREEHFRIELSLLYEEGETIFYTSKMPPWVGSESYWRDHGFKISASAAPVGTQPIHSLLLFAKVYGLRDVVDMKGDKAAARRDLFYDFHQATADQQREWLWHKLLAPQLEVDDAAHTHRLAQMFNTDEINIRAERQSFGRDIWFIYLNKQRGRWWSMWRISKAMSESLDRQFAQEVYERYGFDQQDLFQRQQVIEPEELTTWTDYLSPDDIPF